MIVKKQANRSFLFKGSTLLMIIVILLLLVQFKEDGLQIAGRQLIIVLSGSMEPEIPSGSLLLTKNEEPQDLQVGDIITYKKDADLVTHRIKRIEAAPLGFVTQGDANQQPDKQRVTREEVVGKYCFSIPFIGDFLLRLRTINGIIAVIGVILFFNVLKLFFKPNKKQKEIE